jgi:hypothetical protein
MSSSNTTPELHYYPYIKDLPYVFTLHMTVHNNKNISVIFGTVSAIAAVTIITVLLFLPLPSSGQQFITGCH